MPKLLDRIAFLFGGRQPLQKDPTALLGLDIPIRPDAKEDRGSYDDVALRLAAMPLSVRETFLLWTVDRMSIDQISTRLAIPQRSARRNLRRAIIILAKQADE